MPDETVQLDPADYWKLMKLTGDVDLAQQLAAQLVRSATAARDAFAVVLSTKYPDFQPQDAHYQADDATCTLRRRQVARPKPTAPDEL